MLLRILHGTVTLLPLCPTVAGANPLAPVLQARWGRSHLVTPRLVHTLSLECYLIHEFIGNARSVALS